LPGVSVPGPLRSLASVRSSCHRLSGSRWAAPARGSCGGGRRVRRLHCGARSCGPSPNSLRSLRSLRSNKRREVSLRSALRARAASPAFLVASEIAPAGRRPPRAGTVLALPTNTRPGCFIVDAVAQRGRMAPTNTSNASAKARPGRWQRASSALRSAGLLARARSALRRLTCRHLSERSERSERSEFVDGPRDRAPQGSRRTRRPPKRSADACPGVPLPSRSCPATVAVPHALVPMQVKVNARPLETSRPKQTLKFRNGPGTVGHSLALSNLWMRIVMSRAQGPEPRAQSPEPRAQSPEPRAQSPEPRAQSPEPAGRALRRSICCAMNSRTSIDKRPPCQPHGLRPRTGSVCRQSSQNPSRPTTRSPCHEQELHLSRR